MYILKLVLLSYDLSECAEPRLQQHPGVIKKITESKKYRKIE